MELRVANFVFKSKEDTRSIYSDNRLNDLVLNELLSE
jgi:hypothetical protein